VPARMSRANSLDLLPLLDRSAAALAAVRDEAMLVAAMDDVMTRIVDCEYIGLFFLDRLTGRLRHAFTRGFTEEERRAAELTAMNRHVGEVFRTRTVLYLPDVQVEADPSARVNPRRHPVRSRLTVPVVGRGESVGVISLGNARPAGFSDVQIALVNFVASLAGVVYWNLEDLRALNEQYSLVKAQKEELLDLSAPILEAAPGVLLLPVVGRLDGERCALVAQRLLHTIARRSTRAVVFDLTGMEETGSGSIAALIDIFRAARLMGAECLLSGVTPASARRIVELDLPLPTDRIYPSVHLALAAALAL
jgi:anti-anti-sigma regulatory factor/putative methionine-R-sulfoxide reductase with GAF domain